MSTTEQRDGQKNQLIRYLQLTVLSLGVFAFLYLSSCLTRHEVMCDNELLRQAAWEETLQSTKETAWEDGIPNVFYPPSVKPEPESVVEENEKVVLLHERNEQVPSEVVAYEVFYSRMCEASFKEEYRHLLPHIFSTSIKQGLDPYLIVSVIEQETHFENVMGDGGDSKGLMQIQERWWSGLMAEQGVSDLMVPEDNIKIGILILAGFADKGHNEREMLSRYNAGKVLEHSPYAEAVLDRKESLKKGTYQFR